MRFLVTVLLALCVSTLAQIQTDVPALKNVYAKDFTIGCLLSYRHVGFATDPVVPGQSSVVDANGGYLIKYHMNCMSPGNNMKPQYTVDITSSASAYNSAPQAQKDSIDVHPKITFNADLIAQLNWAKRQNFAFRGHTLVWHSQTPAALFYTGYNTANARLSKEKMIARMTNYIDEVIRKIHEQWPGLLIACDVVNEAIDDNTGAVRKTSNDWYATFGDSTYIMKAFEVTRAACQKYGETQMKLYYNDYSTHVAAKADGIVRLVTPIYQAGLLDGLGMQEHDANATPTAAQWIATYNKFAPVCNEMSVTEFDVATGSASPTSAVLTTQANQYAQLFKCFVERSYFSGRGKIINVSKDGLNDTYTFQTNQASSLWNGQNQCKPAFYSVVSVGKHYNAVDSLIKYSDTLKQNNYTAPSWAVFSTALSNSKRIIAASYSNSIPAADSLQKADSTLALAITGLIRNPSAVASEKGIYITEFALNQNYPNPFNPSTTISYNVPYRSRISLIIFDVMGKKVESLLDGVQETGVHTIVFNGSNLSSGVYYCRLRAEGFSASRKLVLVK